MKAVHASHTTHVQYLYGTYFLDELFLGAQHALEFGAVPRSLDGQHVLLLRLLLDARLCEQLLGERPLARLLGFLAAPRALRLLLRAFGAQRVALGLLILRALLQRAQTRHLALLLGLHALLLLLERCLALLSRDEHLRCDCVYSNTVNR